ncbi:recombinase family protein [Streptomyces sp. NPDC004267]|uniref:recombinase family protein n=1 Tax=Streptomyces sp. NPDC004267 TaxID=3364694 RepID=UPI0036988123
MTPFVSPVGAEHLDTVRVAVYARQSKALPDSSEASPEAQVAAGEALAVSRGWEVMHTFKDVGRSGWDPNAVRPGFEDLMSAVRAGEVDVVVVNELSRLTRKGAHDALEIDKEFKKYGVRFVSVLEPFLDTSNPIGVAIFALIAALAKQDATTRSRRRCRRVWARLAAADVDDHEDREWLAEAALRFALRRDLSGVQEERRETAAHLEHVRNSIAELQADRKAGLYRGRDELAMWRATMTQYRTFEDRCTARLEELDEQTTAAIQVPPDWFAPGEDPLGAGSPWAEWDVLKRREFLDLFLSGVSIGPGRDPESRKYIAIEERVTLHWRHRETDEDHEDDEETLKPG